MLCRRSRQFVNKIQNQNTQACTDCVLSVYALEDSCTGLAQCNVISFDTRKPLTEEIERNPHPQAFAVYRNEV